MRFRCGFHEAPLTETLGLGAKKIFFFFYCFGTYHFKMHSLFVDKKRRLLQKTRNIMQNEGGMNPEMEDRLRRWSTMSDGLTALGAGMWESLRDTKKAFGTNAELAILVDKLYNGPLASQWPEVQSNLQMHGTSARLREIWYEAQYQIRPSAASIVVERALAQTRSFINESVPQIRQQVNELSAADLDLASYKRRTEAMKKTRDCGGPKLKPLEQKLENAQGRFKKLNIALKDSLVKEKISRDYLLEDAVITLLVCQHEMYCELSEGLGELVKTLPPEKVHSIRKKIKDTAAVGGPEALPNESSIKKVINIATGVKSNADYEKDSAAKQAAAAKREEAGMTLAKNEQQYLSTFQEKAAELQPSSPPSPKTAIVVIEEQYRAQFDCEAETAGDLAFCAGDIIYVTRKDDSGWWEGHLGNDFTGQFPANYVQKI